MGKYLYILHVGQGSNHQADFQLLRCALSLDVMRNS
jgi:hypothetical protein